MDGGGNRPLECPLSQPPPPTPASTLSTATSPVLRPVFGPFTCVECTSCLWYLCVSPVFFFSSLFFFFLFFFLVFFRWWFKWKEGWNEFLCDLCIKWNIDIRENYYRVEDDEMIFTKWDYELTKNDFFQLNYLILCDVWFNIKCIRLQVDKSSSWYDQRWKLSKNGTYSYNLKL